MELLSIVPLASNSCPHRSLTSSAHKPQPFWRTMHTLRMTRKRKSVLPSMNRSLTTVVSGDGVQRRRDGNYQPVLWNDDIIQLLSTPYGEPVYRDRGDRLVGEVKEIFNSLTLTPLSDLLQRLSMVDSVERLGIDRHFKNEIKSALNYVYRNTEKLLELAKLEFNIFQSIQKKELESLFRWWKDSGTSHITFTRHRHVEYYTMASCIAFEPQHSGFRLGFAKACHIITVLDDMYDLFGTVDELELFTEAIKRWDPSATDCLPEYMKGVYMMVYNTLNEMSREADKAQGRDTLTYVRQAWEDCIDSYMQEAKWIATGELPTFEEYYENGKVSSAHRISALQPILTTDISFPHHILKEVDFPSKLNDLASAIL